MSRLAPQPRAKAATKQPRRVWLVVDEHGRLFGTRTTKARAVALVRRDADFYVFRVVGPYVLEKP